MSTYLDIRTAITTVERALVDALSLAFQVRIQVADIAALKAITSTVPGVGDSLPADVLRFVASEGLCYRWRKFSILPEMLNHVVLPADRTEAKRGRWERTTSTVTYGPDYLKPVHRQPTGFAKIVQLWQGDEGSEAAMDRIFGLAPAFLVRWRGDDLSMRGPSPRGIHEDDMPFEVWCYSHDNRAELQSLEGSAIPADTDPGCFAMMGLVRYVLAGSSLGLDPGVRYVDIQGQGELIEEDLAQRRFVGVVPILVKASLNIPDEDLVDLREIWAQFQQTGGPSPVIDGTNYLVSGLRIEPAVGLSATPGPGAAYVQGQVVTTQPGAHTFAALSDTYRFLAKDGALYYIAVPNGYDAPQAPTGTLLIGMTQTDSVNIVFDGLQCDYITDSGEMFRAA